MVEVICLPPVSGVVYLRSTIGEEVSKVRIMKCRTVFIVGFSYRVKGPRYQDIIMVHLYIYVACSLRAGVMLSGPYLIAFSWPYNRPRVSYYLWWDVYRSITVGYYNPLPIRIGLLQ
jgi:hypothetical protein